MWSYLLTAVGATTLLLAGKKIWWSWYLGLSGQVLWLTYAIVTKQYGFILSAFIYGSVYFKNARSWTIDKELK